jgi:DNA polymerase III sliding clamp (beta) subunit (PCNA family)
LDYLNSVTEERIVIKLNGGLSPGVFVGEEKGKEGDRIHLVMPVRV